MNGISWAELSLYICECYPQGSQESEAQMGITYNLSLANLVGSRQQAKGWPRHTSE